MWRTRACAPCSSSTIQVQDRHRIVTHPLRSFTPVCLEGAIRSKVNDEPERTYQAGESWTEKSGDHHQVSHNASDTAPAKLLAIFVVDTSDRKIVIPDK